jgi:hypothetical protein
MDVSEELIMYIIRLTRIGELGTNLTLSSNRSRRATLMVEAISFFETSVPTRATEPNMPIDVILPI